MEIIPTGVAGLDEKIEKKGLYAGSCTLVSGSSGAGKTSLSASFAVEAMKKNKRCIYFAFEESIPQLKRNMLSVGFDLEKYEQSDLLKIISTRPSLFGLESHLVSIFNSIEAFQPEVVIFDPVTVLIQVGTRSEIRGMLLRIIDYLKSKAISVFFTGLATSGNFERDLGLSSLVDNWIKLDTVKKGRENKQGITLVKIRGMKHSHYEFIFQFSNDGLILDEPPDEYKSVKNI